MRRTGPDQPITRPYEDISNKPAPAPSKPLRKLNLEKSNSRIKIIVGAAVLLFLALGAGLILWYVNPESVAKRKVDAIPTPFPVYFPDKTQDGKVVPDSIRYTSNVLIYTIKTSNGDLSISQQSAPQGKILTELPATKTLTVDAGKANITRFGSNRVIVTISNGDSLIVVNGSIKISDDHLQNILNSLQPLP